MDAVCCSCQKLVANGARMEGEKYVMIPHPAAGVFIDVGKSGWELEFKDFHNRCDGAFTEPQCLVK